MSISPSKKEEIQAYEKFSQQRFTAIKADNPMMRNTKIHQQIKQQWSTHGKAAFETARKLSSSKRNKQAGQNQEQLNIKKEDEQVDARRKLHFGTSHKKTEMKEDVVQQPKEEREESSIEDVQIEPIRKIISKRKPRISERTKFARYYQNKLKYEHPKWTQRQISNIINLLWRKKLMSDKTTPISKKIIKRKYPLTGRKHFGDMKRKQFMNAQQIRQGWKMLPRQSKIYWGSVARYASGWAKPSKSIQQRICLRQSNICPKKNIQMDHPKFMNALNFMYNAI